MRREANDISEATVVSLFAKQDLSHAHTDRLRNAIERRHDIREAHASLEKLKTLLEQDDGARKVGRKILAVLEDTTPAVELSDDNLEEYRRRVVDDEIDLGEVFDVPSPNLATLCELQRSRGERDPKVVEAIQQRLRLLVHRWEKHTRKPMTIADLVGVADHPSEAVDLGELLQVKAPLSYRPQRTEALSLREHDFMRQGLPGPNGHSADDESGTGSEIVVRAGRATRASAQDDAPKYTFPAPLQIREEIFLDYSVILPIEPGEVDVPAVETIPRELRAAQLLAGHARELLNDRRVERALGTRARTEIDLVLRNVESVQPTTPPSEIRKLRRSLRQTASVVRLLRRVSLASDIAAAAGPDADGIEAAKSKLLAAEQLVGRNVQYNVRAVPSNSYVKQTVIAEPPGQTFPAIVPTGAGGGTAGWGWGNVPPDSVFSFFDAVARICIPSVEGLRAAARDMANSVTGFVDEANAAVVNAASRDLAMVRAFYRFRGALAKVLDELAEVIPVATNELAEGNKRLGLQLIYRQRWIPEGYVRGKLVGYKNLPPDTEESVQRRTFVKTATDTETLDAFTTTRRRESSRTTKETTSIAREIADKNLFSLDSSASFEFSVGSNFGGSFGAKTASQFDLAKVSRQTTEMLSESIFKASYDYNSKREVKLAEHVEHGEEVESTHKIRNLNKEITANYFYYQLLRQYLVTVELHDIRPVLLRSRELPSEGEINHLFLANHAHLLAEMLPEQLAADLMETVDDIEALGREVTDRIGAAEDREAAFEAMRATPRPQRTDENPSAADDWDRLFETNERLMNEARDRLTEAETTYQRARSRLDRVVTHVRENRCRYAQVIWATQSAPDHSLQLAQETFAGRPLPEVTRGLIREGYHGQEEVFTYTGPSLILADLLSENMRSGADIVGSMDEDELKKTPLFEEVARYYGDTEVDRIVDKIYSQSFIVDPAQEDGVLNKRRIQVAQDALVVETLPGQVPLLEAYQLAQRELAVENQQLNNAHLRGRIDAATWTKGTDDRRVYRREGLAVPVEETEA